MQRCRGAEVQSGAEWCREEIQRRCSIGVDEMWRCRTQSCRVQGAEQVQKCSGAEVQRCRVAEMQRCSIDVEM